MILVKANGEKESNTKESIILVTGLILVCWADVLKKRKKINNNRKN